MVCIWIELGTLYFSKLYSIWLVCALDTAYILMMIYSLVFYFESNWVLIFAIKYFLLFSFLGIHIYMGPHTPTYDQIREINDDIAWVYRYHRLGLKATGIYLWWRYSTTGSGQEILYVYGAILPWMWSGHNSLASGSRIEFSPSHESVLETCNPSDSSSRAMCPPIQLHACDYAVTGVNTTINYVTVVMSSSRTRSIHGTERIKARAQGDAWMLAFTDYRISWRKLSVFLAPEL
jgi:hypothetical protein